MSWNDAVEAFKTALPNYEERVSQTALAHEMEAAMDAGQPLLGQAPPGTGKSYPAIITLMDRARVTGLPGVVATATKALQDQYIADCLKIQANVFPEFKFIVLKGRGNYLCKSKMAKADEHLLGINLDELETVASKDDVIGDVERLGFELTITQKSALTTTTDECPGKKTCKFGKTCFAEIAKEKAAESHVIVVNHALLAVDASVREMTMGAVEILPPHPYLVVDEAHELRGYVESALSTSITRNGLVRLVTEVSNFTSDLDLNHSGSLVINPLIRKLENIVGNPKSGSRRTEPQSLTPAVMTQLEAELVAVYEFLQELDGKASVVKAFTDEDIDRKARLRKKVQAMTNKVGKVMADSFTDTVRWIERDSIPFGETDIPPVKLCSAPLDVAPFLASMVWGETNAVMISATLALGDDFTYMAKEHGIDLVGEYRTFDCPSPFDFRTQAVTFVPNGLPDLRSNPDAHLAEFNWQNLELIKAAGGRSMLLFTAWDTLAKSYNELAPRLRDLGYTVYKQGELGSTRALADAFRDDETSVLFATKSFFTGVNIEGSSLLYLGIYKNPFHYPDVLWNARLDAINAPIPERERIFRGAFPKLMLPDMTMTLIQAYGRLIRNMNDRGVVGLFDPSLMVVGGKKYGTKVRNQLPPAPVVTSLKEAVAKLSALRAEIETMESVS